MTYLQIKNYRPTMYGLGRMAKNMSILGTFCRSTWQQKWPPFGHFESGDLVFWWVSRHHSLTHLCHKSAPQLVWLWKLPTRYIKKHDFGIQNGRQSAILDRIKKSFNSVMAHMAPYKYVKLQTSSPYGCWDPLSSLKCWRTDRRRRDRYTISSAPDWKSEAELKS